MKRSTVIVLVIAGAAALAGAWLYRNRSAAASSSRTAADLDRLVVQPENLNQIALDDELVPLPELQIQ